MLTTALSLGAAVSKASSRASNAHQEVISGALFLTIDWLKAKDHLIRKMTAAVGFATLRLVRVRIGDIHIDSFFAGDVVTLPNFYAALNSEFLT